MLMLDDIQIELDSGNFPEAEKKSKAWLASIPLTDKGSISYKRATEAYVYSQYFLNRQESIARLQTDDQRARYYQSALQEIDEIRKKNGFEKIDNPLWRCMNRYLHARIAENYARAFAGQKSYNLDQNEIIQLSFSLLNLEKWKAALDSLDFLLRLQPHNAQINFLMAYAYDKISQKVKTHAHFRDALFFHPEVIAQYPDYLPGEIFEKTWTTFLAQEDDTENPPQETYRKYALLLEINKIYKSDLELADKDLKNIEREFSEKFRLYEKETQKPGIKTAELLHYLCWLITVYQKLSDYEKFEFYRQKMIQLNPQAWETFQSQPA